MAQPYAWRCPKKRKPEPKGNFQFPKIFLVIALLGSLWSLGKIWNSQAEAGSSVPETEQVSPLVLEKFPSMRKWEKRHQPSREEIKIMTIVVAKLPT